jgi:putative oxidoreductase
MLSIFPSFLDYGLLAPFIIRIVVGLIFVDLGYLKIRKERERWYNLFNTFIGIGGFFVNLIALIEMIGGLLLILGLFTQAAALALALLAFLNLYLEWRDPAFVRRSFVFYPMLFAMTLSLLFSGAGFLAIDLPL